MGSRMPLLSGMPQIHDGRGIGRVRRSLLRSCLLSAFVAVLIGVALSAASGAVGVWRYRVATASPWKVPAPLSVGYSVADGGRVWEWTQWRRAGATWWQFVHLPAADIPGTVPTAGEYSRAVAERYGSPGECPALTEEWARSNGLTSFAIVYRLDVGWPFASFTLTQAERTKNPNVAGGVVLRGVDLQDGAMPDCVSSLFRRGGVGYSVLPTSPMLPGALVNWLVWSLVALGLVRGPGLIRSHRRRRRGGCLQCGYDLRGGHGCVCPECGAQKS